MKVLQEMKLPQTNGKKSDFLQIKFLTFLLIIIDGLLDLLDHVDLTLKYFTESENQNIQLSEATCEMMKTTGWRFGIMFSWNFTVTKAELSQS
jgi:hypothetical protein